MRTKQWNWKMNHWFVIVSTQLGWIHNTHFRRHLCYFSFTLNGVMSYVNKLNETPINQITWLIVSDLMTDRCYTSKHQACPVMSVKYTLCYVLPYMKSTKKTKHQHNFAGVCSISIFPTNEAGMHFLLLNCSRRSSSDTAGAPSLEELYRSLIKVPWT